MMGASSSPSVDLLALGLVAMIAQIAILRELTVSFFGEDIIYLLAIAMWLVFNGLGALWRLGGERPSTHLVLFVFTAVTLGLPIDISFVRASHHLFGGIQGSYLDFPWQVTAMFVSVFLPALVLGQLFNIAARRYVTLGHGSLGRAYGLDSLGSLAGGLVAAAASAVQMSNVALTCLCLAVPAALLARTATFARLLGAVALLALAISGAAFAPTLDSWMTRWRYPGLVEVRDTPYGRITITHAGDQWSVFANGTLAFESQSTSSEALGHLAALQRSRPQKVLVLGGGIEGVISDVLQHDPRSIDYVEFNTQFLNLARSTLPPRHRFWQTDPRVHIHGDDPRHYLECAQDYDLIIVNMPDPGSAQYNRFYTLEFFQSCQRALTPDGILALDLSLPENLWTPLWLRRTASIHAALTEVFSSCRILPADRAVLLASMSELTSDPTPVIRRMATRHLSTRLLSEPYIRYLYHNERFHSLPAALEQVHTEPNRDNLPVCHAYTVMLWLSRFYPSLSHHDWSWMEVVGQHGGWVITCLALVSAVLFTAIRNRPTTRVTALAFVAGFNGMILEAVVMLAYQTRSGVLFQDISLLFTSFMGGLAAGAWLLDRVMTRHTVYTGRILVSVGMLLSGTLGLVRFLGSETGLGLSCLFLTLAGAIVSSLFAYCARIPSRRTDTLVAPLYAADLVGGALGGLLAVFILLPFLGFAHTAALVCLLFASAWLLP